MIAIFSGKVPFKDLLLAGLVLAVAVPAGCGGHRIKLETKPTRASLIIQKTAPYQDWAAVRNKMKRECNIQAQVPAMVRKFAQKNFDNVFLYDIIPPDTVATVLTMSIKDARGTTGGVFSGAKSITVEGTVTQDGRVLGTFIDRRASGFGKIKIGWHMSGKKHRAGTCDLLFQCAETIGKDVAVWLKEPTMNAQLGTPAKQQEEEGQSTDGAK